MDRSFLSQAMVVAASRRFVCIRLLTYESAVEAEVLKSFFIGRSGLLENTTFVLLAPDGETPLSRAGRSPAFAFQATHGQNAAEVMAGAMDAISARYEKSEGGGKTPAALPLTVDFRRGLDVAACDGLPLVVLASGDAKGQAALAERAAALAWSAPFVGRFAWAVGAAPADLAKIEGASGKTGLLVVEPDAYGLTGKLLAAAPADADEKTLAKALADGLSRHHPIEKDPRRHIEEGKRLGVRWKTEIPETDPGPRGGGR